MVAAAGAGPLPIPQQEFTTESLSAAIRYCLSPEASRAAAVIAQRMQFEVGVEAAVRSFHRNLPVKRMSCDILPHLPAAFCFDKGKAKIKLSSLATEVLICKAPKDARYFKLYVPQSLCKIPILMSKQIRKQAHQHRDSPMGPHLRRSVRCIWYRRRSHDSLYRNVHQANYRIPRRP
jgi:hypothetical protein